MPRCPKKSVILCLDCKLYTNGFGRMRKILKSRHLDEKELVGLGRAVPVLGTLVDEHFVDQSQVRGLQRGLKQVNKCWDQYLAVPNHLCSKGQESQNSDRSRVTQIAWEENDKQKSWRLRITIPCASHLPVVLVVPTVTEGSREWASVLAVPVGVTQTLSLVWAFISLALLSSRRFEP